MNAPRPSTRPARRFTVVGIYPDNQQVAVFHRRGTDAVSVRASMAQYVSRRNGYTAKEIRDLGPKEFLVCSIFKGHLIDLADDANHEGILPL